MPVFLRRFRLLLLIVAPCLFLCGAHATRINLPDPTGGQLITPIYTSPFGVSFSASSCSILLPNSPYPEAGCFGFLNRSGSDWTALDLVLKSSDPTAFSFQCNNQSPDTPVFKTASCGYNAAAGEYDLDFSDGVIPNNSRQYFVITEDDLDPSTISFEAYPTFATTPEPPAGTLLVLGLLSGSVLLWSKRRQRTAA